MARTRAAKRAIKKGRPKVIDVVREPNGRRSRTSDEMESRLALEVRARRLQISIDEARDQKAGTFMGRLHMAYVAWEKSEKCKSDGRPQPEQSLSTAQYHALLSAKEMHNDYLKALDAPGAYFDPHLGSSGDPEVYARWAENAEKRWTGVKNAIQEAQAYDRTTNLWAALDLCVIQELALPHMIGSLKTLGNVLARSFQRG